MCELVALAVSSTHGNVCVIETDNNSKLIMLTQKHHRICKTDSCLNVYGIVVRSITL